MSLASLFLASAREHTTRPALEVADQVLTYERLTTISSSLAQAVLDHEIDPRPLVGILGARSLSAYSGILATLIAGKGYVPLNVKFPVARSLEMIAQSGVGMLIVGSEALEQLEPILDGCSGPLCVLLPDLADAASLRSRFTDHTFVSSEEIESKTPMAAPAQVSATDTAYLLFTSGSTGKPKGVPISHGNVVPYVSYLTEQYDFSSTDRFSQSFELTFDLSVHDMFVCWSAGACLCVLPARTAMAPAKFIKTKKLTVWFSVPSVAVFMSRMRMLKPGAFPHLRYSLFCGEPLPELTADAWQAAAPESRVVNLYGPTEATIAILEHTWSKEPMARRSKNGVVAIGTVFDSQQACIIDEDRNPLGAGAAGELCLAGSQVTSGYLDDPEKTQAQFVTIPAKGAGIWYRTGDLVERDTDGCHYYLSRIDNQVKILGHRIELQEVDHAIQLCAGTEAAVSIAWPIQDQMAQGIVSFVFGNCTATEAEILSACATRLPEYMVPSRVCFRDTPPLNANGKIDRKQLAEQLTAETSNKA